MIKNLNTQTYLKYMEKWMESKAARKSSKNYTTWDIFKMKEEPFD